MSSTKGNFRRVITPGITYAGQPNLPRLPIPSLEETLERFPALVTAIVDKKDMEKLGEEVTKFLETDGPVLQKLLIEYEQKGREEGKLGSFVEEFWSDAYLTPDSSVVMNLNPFFVLEVCSHFLLIAC
jgi:carnitine O-acetyltransferase